MRAWWFPAALCVVILANGLLAFRYVRELGPMATYRITARSDDSLAAAVPARPAAFGTMIRQLLAIQSSLGGAVLMVPTDLSLNATSLQLFARLEIQQERRAPIDPGVADELEAESDPAHLLLAGRRLYVARDLRPPWTAPLHLIEAHGSPRLFVVSGARLDRLGGSVR